MAIISSSISSKAVPRVVIGGTGLTALFTAYFLSKQAPDVKIVLIGKKHWRKDLDLKYERIYDRKIFGPVGIQTHSGSVLNASNEIGELIDKCARQHEGPFYTSPTLCLEGTTFLDSYKKWHANHPDPLDEGSSLKRQEAIVSINRYASKLWHELKAETPFLDFLHLKGSYHLYEDSHSFLNAQRKLQIFDKLSYGAEMIEDSALLAERIPFYKRNILKYQKMGIFFANDGLVESNLLRAHLWRCLNANSNFAFNFESQIEALDINSQGACEGFILENKMKVRADLIIMAMGVANKHLLGRHGHRLPLWNIWEDVFRAELVEGHKPPEVSVSLNSQMRYLAPTCFAGAPDGKTVVLTGTTLVVNEDETASGRSELLKNSLFDVYGDPLKGKPWKSRIREETMECQPVPSAAAPDDLPIISLGYPMKRLVVLNPTFHLGVTQAPAIGSLASIYALNATGYKTSPFPPHINLNRFRFNRF